MGEQTNNAAWFINDNKLSFYIMMENFNRSGGDWRFVPVDNIPVERYYCNEVAEKTLKHTLSDRHRESLCPASQSCH